MFCAERRAQCCKIVRKFNFTHDYFVGKWKQNKFVFLQMFMQRKKGFLVIRFFLIVFSNCRV